VKVLLVDFFLNGHHVEHAAFLGRYLLEYGHEVTFATWRQNAALEVLSAKGLRICYVGEGTLRGDTLRMIPQVAQGIRRCLTIAQDEGASIVHLLYLDRAAPLPLWWNCWSRNQLRIFGTLWWPYHFIRNPGLSVPEKLYHSVVRMALRNLVVSGKLSGLFVHTERIKNVVLHGLGARDVQDHLIVVPDPLPDVEFKPGADNSSHACRTRLGLPAERVILLFFGELRETKGPDILLKATHRLPVDALILYAGAPAGSFSSRDWEAQVTRGHLNDRVRLDLGHVPNELVPVYFRAADAVVLPYRRSFLATSGVLQWAAAAGRPVIATNVGDVGNLVKRYGLGLVVEPEDPDQLAHAIGEFIRNRRQISKSVATCAAQYSAANHWRQTAASVLAAYQYGVRT
jgi:glycosyltransferase involved in cell wall biosynthesis